MQIKVRGTAGYERWISHFIENSQALDFHEVCKSFIEFLPVAPANILDVGAGAGQNAMALAQMGHSVVAVEPMPEFLDAARKQYALHPIIWHQDSLPDLICLGKHTDQFDFILVDGVWHHLAESERERALQRFSALLKVGGRCALSLRNGPPGMGTLVFPTDAGETINQAKPYGLTPVMTLENQPSLFSYKTDVTWSRLVLQKTSVI